MLFFGGEFSHRFRCDRDQCVVVRGRFGYVLPTLRFVHGYSIRAAALVFDYLTLTTALNFAMIRARVPGIC